MTKLNPIKDPEKEAREKARRAHYRACFNSKSGDLVLEHLDSVVEGIEIDRNDFNSNSAVWYAAQRALIKTILNQLA